MSLSVSPGNQPDMPINLLRSSLVLHECVLLGQHRGGVAAILRVYTC